ncbi:MAG: putative quinol monooxygenase [Ramlibacter sp.]
MIIVIGHATASEGTQEEANRLALEHVRRSRTEPGCLSHEVSRDLENAQRLVFIEKWTDMQALQAHFRVPESRAFVRAMERLTDGNVGMTLHQVEPTPAP